MPARSASAFDEVTRAAAFEANLGKCAGCAKPATEVHHRRPRGMGGSSRPEIGDASNAVPLCREHHHWAEHNREEARRIGWLLEDWQEPDGTPWWASPRGSVRWVLDDGCWLIELVRPRS